MMNARTLVAAMVLATALLVSAEPPAGKGGGSHGPSSGAGEAEAERGAAARVFSPREQQIIRDWFEDPRHASRLPPGIAKRERLPPGLEKQLQRNGKLPPGLEKKLQPLPDDLVIRLGVPPPRGIRRVILGDDVLLLDERTSAILDIVHDVIRLKQTF